MDYEFGPSSMYVYIGNDGINGKSKEALEATAAELEQAPEGLSPMRAALREIINNGSEDVDGLVDRFKSQGRFMLGIENGIAHDHFNAPFDGLFYAEAEQPQDDGAFSIVRMGIWISKERAEKKHYDEQSLRMSLLDMSLDEVTPEEKDDIWGVPVSRETKIIDTSSSSGLLPDGYIFGHVKDMESIRSLDVPESLKNLIAELVNVWHESEQAGELDAKIAKIREALA